MFYYVKRKFMTPQYEIIEAKCNRSKRWTNMRYGTYSYDYDGINDDYGKGFTTEHIVAKSKSKKALYKKYAHELI